MAKTAYGNPVIRVRIAPETIAAAQARAAAGSTTLSGVVRAALIEYLDKQQSKTPAA